MEQKRTLWIVAAVGVFLIVVVGAAVVLSSAAAKQACPMQTYYNPADGFVNAPKVPAQGTMPSQPVPDSSSPEGVAPAAVPQYGQAPVEPNGMAPQGVAPVTPDGMAPQGMTPQGVPPVQGGVAPVPGTAPVKVENVTVIADNALVYGTGTTTTIDLNDLKSNPTASSVTPKNQMTASQMSQAQQAPVSVPQTTYTPAPDSYYAPAPKAEKPAAKAPSSTTVKKAAPKTTAKTAKAPAKKSSVAAKTASKPAAPSTFWIQVGSYEAKKTADEARSILEANKISNEVFTYKDAKGKLFYRVRVGPYTTKSEAEYWQKRISAIDQFEKTNSYVVKN